jgi:hypothetical protein
MRANLASRPRPVVLDYGKSLSWNKKNSKTGFPARLVRHPRKHPPALDFLEL